MKTLGRLSINVFTLVAFLTPMLSAENQTEVPECARQAPIEWCKAIKSAFEGLNKDEAARAQIDQGYIEYTRKASCENPVHRQKVYAFSHVLSGRYTPENLAATVTPEDLKYTLSEGRRFNFACAVQH